MESKLNLEYESRQSLNEFISSEEFQDIIHERKKEVEATAKETIKHDRELIAERNFMVENDSLLKNFPKESLPPMLTGFRLNWLEPIPIQFLQPLKKLYSALSTLTVCFDGSVSVGDAFSFINCFPFLESLSVTFWDPRIGSDTIPMLKLSKLRKCIVTCLKGKMNYAEGGKNVIFFCALQFLIHCKKLQSLRWTNWFTDIHLQHFLLNYEYHGNMIDFKGGHWDLNRSNIWKVFPELREINVRLEFTTNRGEFDSRSTQESFALDKAYRKFCKAKVNWRKLESNAY